MFLKGMKRVIKKFISSTRSVLPAQGFEQIERLNLGLSTHRFASQPWLVDNMKVFSTWNDGDENLIHWYEAEREVQTGSTVNGGSGHPSSSSTFYTGHKYVGSLRLKEWLKYDHCNNRVQTPDGKWYGIDELFKDANRNLS